MSKLQEGSGPHYIAPPMGAYYNIKKEGKVDTLFISAKALNIVWGNDSRYWQWRALDELQGFKSVMPEVGAEFQQVNWIEVTGRLDISKVPEFFRDIRSKTYEIIWVVNFNVDAFGWQTTPIKFKVASGGQLKQRSEKLEPYRKKGNQWHEISGGEFTVTYHKKEVVDFGMYETESDWWKGSMVLAGVKIRPKA